MSTDTPKTDAGEAAAMYASEYHKVRQELEEAKKWRGVMTDIADKTQQRCAILESQLAAEQEKVKRLESDKRLLVHALGVAEESLEAGVWSYTKKMLRELIDEYKEAK